MGPGGKQRTDSTHVVAAVRDRHRLELAGESVRACLEALAVAAPWWLAGVIDVPGWSRRYSVRVDSWRLPSSQAKRVELALAYARDGYALVEACYRADTPGWRREVEAVQVLRIVLLQNATRTVTEAGTEVQANRADQDAADWQARYAIRAGVEGTIHQAIARHRHPQRPLQGPAQDTPRTRLRSGRPQPHPPTRLVERPPPGPDTHSHLARPELALAA